MTEPKPAGAPRRSLAARVVRPLLGLLAVSLFAVPIVWRLSTLPAQDQRPPRATRAVPVSIAAAGRQDLSAFVVGEGTARASMRNYLHFKAAGVVEELMRMPDGREIRAGDRVKKGDLLARIDDRTQRSTLEATRATVKEAMEQEQSARADLDQAIAGEKQAKAELDRVQELFDSGTKSRADLDVAQAQYDKSVASTTAVRAHIRSAQASIARAQASVTRDEIALEDTRIVAPDDGTIAYLNIVEGVYWSTQAISTSDEDSVLQSVPIVLIDTGEFEITLDLPVFDGTQVKVGQRAWVSTGVDLGKPLASGVLPTERASVTAVVHSVTPAATPGGRSLQIKLRSKSGAEHLLDGTFVAAWIEVEHTENAVVVPANALVFRDNQPFVFVVDENLVARRRRVELGIRSFGRHEILSGLEAGERFVTEGRTRLSEGSLVSDVSKQKEAR